MVRKVATRRDRAVTAAAFKRKGLTDRPHRASCYIQTGVVPYRLGTDGPEILIVTNTKGTKWAIPKGVHAPGYSARASAAKEAFEEAGILGKVEKEALGTYTQRKWGGVCKIRVFPMRVTEVLDEAEWEESHRTRRWVPAAKAAGKIKRKGLREIVARFAAGLTAD
jgi:phosphohistidine phosphatase